MAHTEILITGLEIFLAAVLFLIIRLAIKNSKFKRMNLFSEGAKYRHLSMVLLLLPLLMMGQNSQTKDILVGAERPGAYLPLLYGKRIAVVANQTSMVHDEHLVDFLLDNKMKVVKVFAPEHGFRGKASAGENIDNSTDTKTGLPVISLYGNTKKPTPAQMADIDMVVFDIQDVGTRFYTYVSTLTYVMQACAENGKRLVVLDRPNPNGYYVDGPVLKSGYESFVGMHHVPAVYGLTLGEYATMVNGEGWLPDGEQCQLDVVQCTGWDHTMTYDLPIKPSPNLPNKWAISLYPSLCFFEGTDVSVGRGTDKPFQQIGAPYFEDGNTTFTPQSNEGANHPKYEGRQCKGYDLTDFAQYYINGLGKIYLFWLTEAYKIAPDKDHFFNDYFDKLAGTDQLRKDIIAGKTPEQIHESWQPDLETYMKIRQKYLLYPDFQIN